MHFYMFWFFDILPFLVTSPAVYQGWGLHLAGSSPAGFGCPPCGEAWKSWEPKAPHGIFMFRMNKIHGDLDQNLM